MNPEEYNLPEIDVPDADEKKDEEEKPKVVDDMAAILASIERIADLLDVAKETKPSEEAQDLIERYEVDKEDAPKDSIQRLVDTYLDPIRKEQEKKEEEKDLAYKKELGIIDPKVEDKSDTQEPIDEKEIFKQFDVKLPQIEEDFEQDALTNKIARKLAELKEQRRKINQLLLVQDQFQVREPFKHKEELKKQADEDLKDFSQVRANIGASPATKDFLTPLADTKKYLDEIGGIAEAQMTSKTNDILREIKEKAKEQRPIETQIAMKDILEIKPGVSLDNFSDAQLDDFLKKNYIPVRADRKHKIQDIEEHFKWKEALKQTQKVKEELGLPTRDLGLYPPKQFQPQPMVPPPPPAVPYYPQRIPDYQYTPQQDRYRYPYYTTPAPLTGPKKTEIITLIRQLRGTSLQNLCESLGIYYWYGDENKAQQQVIDGVERQSLRLTDIRADILKYPEAAYIILLYLSVPNARVEMTLDEMKSEIRRYTEKDYRTKEDIRHRKPTERSYRWAARSLRIPNAETLQSTELQRVVEDHLRTNAKRFETEYTYQDLLRDLDIYFVALIAYSLGIKPGRKIKRNLIDQITGRKEVRSTSRVGAASRRRRDTGRRKGRYVSWSLSKVENKTRFNTEKAKQSVTSIQLSTKEGYVNTRDIYSEIDLGKPDRENDLLYNLTNDHGKLHLGETGIWHICITIGLEVTKGRSYRDEILWEMKYRIASFPLHWAVLPVKKNITRNTHTSVIYKLSGMGEPNFDQTPAGIDTLLTYNRQNRTTFSSSKYLSLLAIDLGNATDSQINQCLEFFGYIPYTSLAKEKRLSTVRSLMKHAMPNDAKSHERLPTSIRDMTEAREKLKFYLRNDEIPKTVERANKVIYELSRYRENIDDIQRIKDVINRYK